jgi:hypothetical protein
MSNPSELQTKLALQTSTCGWSIVKTVALGIAAGAVALYGQHSLSAARPIFPFIEQNFGLWQSAYVVTELLMSLVWVAALLQKTNRFQESLKQLQMQKTIDEKKEVRAQQAVVRRAAQAEVKKFVPKTARSTKFDY